MMAFPHASDGAIFHVAMTSGKFHGVMSAHTPTGSRSDTSRPGSWTGMVSPRILFAAPPQYSNVFATIPISPRAALIGLPAFRLSAAATSTIGPPVAGSITSNVEPSAASFRSPARTRSSVAMRCLLYRGHDDRHDARRALRVRTYARGGDGGSTVSGANVVRTPG